MALGAEPEAVGPELLTNGGFEEADGAGELPAAWRGFFTRDWGECAGTCRRSGLAPREGRFCIELSGVRTQYAALHSRRIPADPAKAYFLTAWVRTELRGDERAFLVASWLGERRWLSLTRSRSLRARTPWRRVAVVLTPQARPRDARTLQVSFRVIGSSGRGRAWADQVSLRECRIPPPPPAAELQRQRQLDMARELLVERLVWTERLWALKRRRTDLERLLEETQRFHALQEQLEDAVCRRGFLAPRQRRRRELEKAVPTDAAGIRAQAARIRELAALREKCFAELERTLALKRQLDARPHLRRFFLWAQLASLRYWPPLPRRRLGRAPRIRGQAAPKPPPLPSTAEFRAALADPPDPPSGELWETEVRTALDHVEHSGEVFVRAPAVTEPGVQLEAGLFAAGGRLVAFGGPATDRNPARLRLSVREPALWFPDCPHLYTLKVGLFRGGKAVDWLERKVAFREIRIAECDVSPTMRHAWRWAAADYTWTVNGQPWFPAGTVCGALSRDHLEEAAGLFDELWLDFQRTYGTFLPRLDGGYGEVFARHGLTFLASLRPNYQGIRHYVSSRKGLERYRDLARECRRLASHPAILAIETGNEAELSVWGADLPSVYGRDLWHAFNEVSRVLRTEMEPDVPVAYVRAAHFGRVLPVPRNDYCGVNQYTGRYWGRRATISSDLAALAHAATFDAKPIGITEWNGPKYSWATSGVSGVDEEGAAQYVFDYWQRMLRTPTVVLSTEFVLNWIVTPLEDLTTVPLAEGLENRARWSWSLQQGTPWYPRIWPGLLTDTPARRAMRGFQSPLYPLCSAPGTITVASSTDQRPRAKHLAEAIRRLGRQARVHRLPAPHETWGEDTNFVMIGGYGDEQPGVIRHLELIRVIGRTTAHLPAPGQFLIQRRVNPKFPDRFLIVATAADAAGMDKAVEKLTAAAAGLGEALARQATCRRALALIDDRRETRRIFSRYVLELPTRSRFLGWDDLRTKLEPAEFLAPDGQLRPHWADLGAIIVATRRKLGAEESHLLRKLPRLGANVVWSAATLDANPDAAKALGVRFGPAHSLTERFPVAKWAQQPLAVPELGDIAADRVEKFGRLKPGTKDWRRATTIREVVAADAAWEAAVERAVVRVRREGKGAHWVFGADLSAAAAALWQTTHRGVNHHIYDRDTACGLERLFRLVANACAFRHGPRPAATPRLRAKVVTDRDTYAWGDTLRVEVQVRDAEGAPCGAAVRVGFSDAGISSSSPEAVPQRWAHARRLAKGRYLAEAQVVEKPGPDALVPALRRTRSHRGQRLLNVFADVARPGCVSDWTAHTVRIGSETDERGRMAELVRRVERGLVAATLNVHDREKWVEVMAEVVVTARVRAGEPARFELCVTRIEHDSGGDWMENVELVLRSAEGETVALPVAPGKTLASPRAPIIAKRPAQCMVVDSAHPARFDVLWPKARAGVWALSLRYLYTDDWHREDTERLPRDDPFPRLTVTVSRGEK